MVIKYKVCKKGIKIFSDAKILSSAFKQWFLKELSKNFDLYEKLDDQLRFLDSEIIEKSIVLDVLYIDKLKNFYELENINYITFEELLEIEKVLFADIFIFDKGANIALQNVKTNLSLVAVIDLQPDGDSDSLWIDRFSDFSLFIKLVEKYNTEGRQTGE